VTFVALNIIERLDAAFFKRYDAGIVGHSLYCLAESAEKPLEKDFIKIVIMELAKCLAPRWKEADQDVIVWSIKEGYMEQWRKGVNSTAPDLTPSLAG
jgi:hypothetical protein